MPPRIAARFAVSSAAGETNVARPVTAAGTLRHGARCLAESGGAARQTAAAD